MSVATAERAMAEAERRLWRALRDEMVERAQRPGVTYVSNGLRPTLHRLGSRCIDQAPSVEDYWCGGVRVVPFTKTQARLALEVGYQLCRRCVRENIG